LIYLERRWKYRKTMAEAIATSSEMLKKEDYMIESITTEYSSIGQD
jgi:hypothetical protein